MTIAEDLEAIAEGKIPKGRMSVKTTHGSKDIEFRGINGNGFRIPLDEVEVFIRELEQTCRDPQTLYMVGQPGFEVEIPGLKVPKIALYLRDARDAGVHLGGYTRIF